MPFKPNALLPGMFKFEGKRRHVLRAAPIHHVDLPRAQPDRRIGGIDGRIAGTDHSHALRHCGHASVLISRDQVERIGHAFQIFSRHAESMDRAQPGADEECVMGTFELCQHGRIHRDLKLELHAEPRNHIDLTQALGQRQLVLRDSIRV